MAAGQRGRTEPVRRHPAATRPSRRHPISPTDIGCRHRRHRHCPEKDCDKPGAPPRRRCPFPSRPSRDKRHQTQEWTLARTMAGAYRRANTKRPSPWQGNNDNRTPTHRRRTDGQLAGRRKEPPRRRHLRISQTGIGFRRRRRRHRAEKECDRTRTPPHRLRGTDGRTAGDRDGQPAGRGTTTQDTTTPGTATRGTATRGTDTTTGSPPPSRGSPRTGTR